MTQPEQEWKNCRHCGFQYRPPKDGKWHPLEQPDREWVGLSSLDKTFLRTAYAQLRPLYHDKKEDVSVAAEVVTDWDGFFAAINDKLKEKNNG